MGLGIGGEVSQVTRYIVVVRVLQGGKAELILLLPWLLKVGPDPIVTMAVAWYGPRVRSYMGPIQGGKGLGI